MKEINQTFTCKKCEESLDINLHKMEGFCFKCYKIASENNTPVWKPYGYERNLV